MKEIPGEVIYLIPAICETVTGLQARTFFSQVVSGAYIVLNTRAQDSCHAVCSWGCQKPSI